MKNRFISESGAGKIGFLWGKTLLAAFVLMALSLVGFRFAAEKRVVTSGIWGTMDVQPMILTVPFELEPELREVPVRNPWVFPGWKIDDTRIFLESVEMPAELKGRLIDAIRAYPQFEGSVLMPSEEDVYALPRSARTTIYNYLSRYEINYEQSNARRYPAKSMKQWMKHIPLSKGTMEALETLSYRNGSLLFFADASTLLNRISEEERFRVYKALHRIKTWNISLCAGKHADLQQLVRYWGVGGHENEVMPFIEAAQEDGGRVDLDSLLPSLPRRLIYRYPKTGDAHGTEKDCHWTAFNFFSRRPDYRLQEDGYLQELIARDYGFIPEENLQFGDLIIYLDSHNEEVRLMHSAVYMGADIVFTKNGTSCVCPWMYMQMTHMDDYYSYGRPLQKRYLRMKPSSLERIQHQVPGKRGNRAGKSTAGTQ